MRPYPPHPHPWIPSKFDCIMFIILMVIMVIFNLCACTTTSTVNLSADSDLCRHVLVKDTHKCTKCGVKAVDPFTYSEQIIEHKHIFVNIDGSDKCVCIECRSTKECEGWNIPDGVIVLTPNRLPDTLSTGCQHTNMMRTMMGCSPPNNQCNTCTCLDCDYSYPCN